MNFISFKRRYLLNYFIFVLLPIYNAIAIEENFDLDLNDILDDKLMPANLFLQPFAKGSNITRKHFYSIDIKNGSTNMNDALNIMKFHRIKMNEYMASNFIAKQIISSLALNPTRMQRRLGIANEDFPYNGYNKYLQNRVKFPNIADPNTLLYDPGSQGYKQWLQKSSTLEDIHRQFAMNSTAYIDHEATQTPKLSYKRKNKNTSSISTASEETEENDDENEYEEGEVTGYIYPKQNIHHLTGASDSDPNAPIKYTRYHNLAQTNYAQQNPNEQVNTYQKPQTLSHNYVQQNSNGLVYTYHKPQIPAPEQGLQNTNEQDYTYHKPQTPSPLHSVTAPSAITHSIPNIYENKYSNYPTQPVPTAKSKSVLYYQSPHFATNGNIPNEPKKNTAHHYPNQNYISPSPTAVNVEQHETEHKGYYGPTSHDHYEQHVEHHYPVEETEKKEITLKDVFDIALTTLAFLSFGMFILQVLMCITMSNNSYNYSSNMMMMTPMESTDNVDDGVEEIRRKRRSVEVDRIIKVNELSKKILLSIDGFINASEDNGKCLQRILCENNQFARKQKDGQKLWMPIWSLALSWLMNARGLALQSLKATAIGLGGGNCNSFVGCTLGSRK